MNTKICTSIEQSKKLIELGVDVNTSDMFWGLNKTLIAYPYPYNEDKLVTADKTATPAWSLTALLELMPERIKINGELSFCLSMKKSPTGYGFTYGTDETTFCNDSLIDAAYEMVVWLKENRW